MIGRLATPAFYRAMSQLAGPALTLYLARRKGQGKEDANRFGERLGQASHARPAGRLIWLHGASVGEALSLLPLVAGLKAREPLCNLLITTGTVSSARLLASRLAAGALHQYVPIDRLGPVRRFLDHWRPDLALWVESELWPNLVCETAKRGIPMALLNGRLSARSERRWLGLPRLIRPLLESFALVLAQSEADVARFQKLGAREVRLARNLKYDAPPLGHDPAALDHLRAQIGARPLWLAASTHEGEEIIAARLSEALRARLPDLLTVIVPRHPARGPALAHSLAAAGARLARRSQGEPITSATTLYLADTMGELGLFYRLAPIVLIGGTMVPHGGHNPLEPARLDCALLAGPHMENFADIARHLESAGALERCVDEAVLRKALGALLADSALRERRAQAALRAAGAFQGGVAVALDAVLPLLARSTPNAVARAAHARA
jgi:3-deoxy-D-manno-octulosonic-acid transferase